MKLNYSILFMTFMCFGCSWSKYQDNLHDYYFETMPAVTTQIRKEAQAFLGKDKQAVAESYGKEPRGGFLRRDVDAFYHDVKQKYHCEEEWHYRLRTEAGFLNSIKTDVYFCFEDDAVIGVGVY